MSSEDNYRGFITDCSKSIDGVEIGMAFVYDGSALSVYGGKPLSKNEQASMAFNIFWERETIDVFFTCQLSSSGQSAVFHAFGTMGVRGCEFRFPVVDYWVLSDGKKLKDANEIVFAGPSVDSFCPMTGVEFGDGFSLCIPALEETKVECGASIVGEGEVLFSTLCGWKGNYDEGITFESALVASLDCPADYKFLKDLYIAVFAALRFCLGRGNVGLNVRLRERNGECVSTIGEFVACHGKMFVPDKRDELKECFVRSRDVSEGFGRIVEFFGSGEYENPAFDRDRDDARIITYSKVIDLCASFEREFKRTFPDGIKHSASTERKNEEVRAELLKLAKKLSSDEGRIVARLINHVGDDSLQARISHALKKMSNPVAVACKSS